MSTILAIDPGPQMGAWVEWCPSGVVHTEAEMDNESMLLTLRDDDERFQHVAIEMIACMGMPVGAETFETVLFIGRVIEICHRRNIRLQLVYRRDVKMHFCNSMKAKDSNIRQALIDRHGGKQRAIGNAKAHGPLYCIKSHAWSALAIALYAHDNPAAAPQPAA